MEIRPVVDLESIDEFRAEMVEKEVNCWVFFATLVALSGLMSIAMRALLIHMEKIVSEEHI
jgi:hypothetical protein